MRSPSNDTLKWALPIQDVEARPSFEPHGPDRARLVTVLLTGLDEAEWTWGFGLRLSGRDGHAGRRLVSRASLHEVPGRRPDFT